jgi:hypothetical protein
MGKRTTNDEKEFQSFRENEKNFLVTLLLSEIN